MFTYHLLLEYDGTNFIGWQSQKNGRSIQDSIEKILSKMLNERVKLHGAGRTDSGVHAIGQSAHFQTKNKLKDKNKFLNSVNFFLGKKLISILNIKKKSNNFHARHSAKRRVYEYIIINRQSALSLEKNKAWLIKKKLNIDLMKKGASYLKTTKDFSTFRASSCGAKSPIKTMEKVQVHKKNEKIKITFISRSFLQQQVRSMVGCLKYLAEGKWSLKQFKLITNLKKRSGCAPPAPACGLYLKKINY